MGLLLFQYSSRPLVQPSSIKQKILDSVFLSIFRYGDIFLITAKMSLSSDNVTDLPFRWLSKIKKMICIFVYKTNLVPVGKLFQTIVATYPWPYWNSWCTKPLTSPIGSAGESILLLILISEYSFRTGLRFRVWSRLKLRRQFLWCRLKAVSCATLQPPMLSGRSFNSTIVCTTVKLEHLS